MSYIKIWKAQKQAELLKNQRQTVEEVARAVKQRM